MLCTHKAVPTNSENLDLSRLNTTFVHRLDTAAGVQTGEFLHIPP